MQHRLIHKKAVEDVAALGQYSGWLLGQANQIQMEMEMLREKNKKLEEALDFYADRETYRLYEDEQGRKIEIVNNMESERDDLMADFVSIITSFCARLYGLRRNKRRTEKLIEELQKEDNK